MIFFNSLTADHVHADTGTLSPFTFSDGRKYQVLLLDSQSRSRKVGLKDRKRHKFDMLLTILAGKRTNMHGRQRLKGVETSACFFLAVKLKPRCR